MTYYEAIERLKQRNENYAARKNINIDYVRENEAIINALIKFANEQEKPLLSKEDKKPFPFAIVEMSGYEPPITNTKPQGNYLLWYWYNFIIGNLLKEKTEKLRSIPDPATARKFKAENFPYVTFSGTFTKRDSNFLVKHSNLMMIDFDHVGNISAIQELKSKLLKDKYFDTMLMFRSPSGDGLKWLINIDITRYSHKCWFDGIYHYVKNTYGLEIDKSGSDVARACFLCHDAQAYINPNIYKGV